MIKQARNFAALGAMACLLALPAQANVVFSAQFLELWPFEGGDLDVDLAGDEFSIDLQPLDAETYDVNIDGIVITYAPGIVNDLGDSGTFFSEGGSALPFRIGLDAANSLFLPFLGDGFGVGDNYFVNIDVDDDDAYVPGSAFFGSTLEVLYTDNNAGRAQGFAESTFGACGGDADPNGQFCSFADVQFQLTPGGGNGVVPAPMSVALLGIGLLGLGWRRRK